jgi:hypothetical protein
MLRDCDLLGFADSTNLTGGVAYLNVAIAPAAGHSCVIKIINGTVYGSYADYLMPASGITVYLQNTPYDPSKNPTLTALAPTISSLGTYLVDPVITAGTASGGGSVIINS